MKGRGIALIDLKKGDRFCEADYGYEINMVAECDAYSDADGVHCYGVKDDGERVHLFHAHTYEHYGPKLYATDFPHPKRKG